MKILTVVLIGVLMLINALQLLSEYYGVTAYFVCHYS